MTNKTKTTIESNIHTRALLVWLSISTWSARKYDRKVTQDVAVANGATVDAGRYNKLLLPADNDSYKKLVSLASTIRAEHYVHTLAWSDEGWRLLTTANYQQYTDWLRTKTNEFTNAADAFVDDYPAMRAAAPRLLGKMYRDDDYPSKSDVRHKFRIAVQYMPLPAFGDVRVNLASDQIDAIERSIADNIRSATQTAMQDAYGRLYSVVTHALERLSEPEAIFRDTLISNIVDTCDALKRLNVTDDPMLEKLRAQAEKELTRTSTDTLRDNKHVRRQVADRAQAIVDSMRAVYQPDAA